VKKIVFDHALSQAIVDTIREPLLVLDEDLRVVVASRSFYQTFKV
jgi:PAS domain-containing protein